TDLETILQSPLRGILFVEVLGVVREVAEDLLQAAQNLEAIYQDNGRFQVIASPHSVHALHPEVLAKLFSKERPVLSIHLGESEDEDRYFREQSGPLYEFIRKRVREIPLQDQCLSSSFQYLHHQNLLSSKIMAVHCNYLDESDLDLIAHHQMSVVYCPSSHAY